MAEETNSRDLSKSNSSLTRQGGHYFASVEVTDGYLMQGDSYTIHNNNYYSKARAKSDSETTKSSHSADNDTSEELSNVKFIVPRCSAPYFTGRSVQFTQLQDYLSNPPDNGLSRRIVVIIGTGGAGKTQFCLKYAEAHQSESVDLVQARSHADISSGIGVFSGLMQATRLPQTAITRNWVGYSVEVRHLPLANIGCLKRGRSGCWYWTMLTMTMQTLRRCSQQGASGIY